MMSSTAEHGTADARTSQPHDRALIEMSEIVVRYGSVMALRGVDFELLPGEVHGLLGQNGAGKTTLIKVMAGIISPTAGEFRIGGEAVRLAGVADSKAKGIAVVHQTLSLVPNLTVADNMFLGSETLRGRILLDREVMRKKAQEILHHYGIPLKANQPVESLTFAYRQLLEIAKALAFDSKVLILDEPTSSLTKAEEPILFGAIREVTRRGIGVVYVSHRLSEIMELTDRVTVFRDGSRVGSFHTTQTTIPELVETIVGAPVERMDAAVVRSHAPSTAGPAALELRAARAAGVHGVDLQVRAGEILGLVGTTGSGRTEILETVFGARSLRAGEMLLDGERFAPGAPAEAIRRGVKLVPEDRHRWGAVLDHNIEQNIAMANLPEWTRSGLFFASGRARSRSEEARQRLKIKAGSIAVRVNQLSGGNQQKVVVGKWLEGRTSVLLLDEPTAGVDVGARADIYQIIVHLAENGAAIVVSSSDYDELLQLCTSLAFVTNGRVSAPIDRRDVTDERDLHRLLEESRKDALS